MSTGGTIPAWRRELARPQGADVFRVLAVGMVAAFHFWQQTWIGGGKLDYLLRTGCAWVDGMILLSAFCLYLPHALDAAEGRPFAGTPGFFWRRVVRLVPAYWAATLLCGAVDAVQRGLDAHLIKDILAHLLLVPTLFPESYIWARTNGALWTVGVLVQFYLLFPLLARAFRARPVLTFAGLCAVQAGWSIWITRFDDWRYSFTFNQLPAFAEVLALGFAAAMAVAGLGCRVQGRWRWGFTLLAAGALWAAARVLRYMNDMGNIQRAQLLCRMPLVFCLALALVGLCLGVRLPGGRVWAFLSGISYQFYLWHQWLAVQLKYHLRLPPWQGDTPPNQLGDTVWMWRYFALILAVSLGAAALLTYTVERPAAAALRRLWPPARPQSGQIPQKACK